MEHALNGRSAPDMRVVKAVPSSTPVCEAVWPEFKEVEVENVNSKCFLPSIQSLIGTADSSGPKHEQQRKPPSRMYALPSLTVSTAEAETQKQQQQGRNTSTAISQALDYTSPTISDSKALSLSPPQGPDFRFNNANGSPSASSSQSSVFVPPYFSGAINKPDPHQQRQRPPPCSQPGQSPSSSAYQSPYQALSYPQSAETISKYPYLSSTQRCLETPSMYNAQQPLPSAFPPSNISVSNTPSTSNSHGVSSVDQDNPSQHHHYISPSSSAAFADQPQNKYICQTCNKEFLRPSSLRIHNHSHTGEKPFKCPHAGCGKAYSVRSNMKRHQRGCHGSESLGSS